MPVLPAPGRAYFMLMLLAVPAAAQGTVAETFLLGVEWRLMRAGEVRMTLNHPTGAEISVRSLGLLNNLFKVNDQYTATFGPGGV